jgi:violaxanthin de-epoxidase
MIYLDDDNEMCMYCLSMMPYRYVLDYEPDNFVLVYYMGSNDAWDGYGGAFLYTRSPTVNPQLVPRLEAAVQKMGLKYRWSDFTITGIYSAMLQ